MGERLFGTDGIRGTAGVYPLDVPTVRRIGAAIVRALSPDGGNRLLIGRDTRESGGWIERELAYGIRESGASAASVGVAPTPAIAFLASSMGFDAGVAISASHNSYEDNGIKVFSGRGQKYTERFEREIEAIVADRSWRLPDGDATSLQPSAHVESYLDLVRTALPDPALLRPLRIAVDCANGAMSAIAPRLLRGLGFDVHAIAGEPDGRNINLRCGSTHPETLAAVVASDGFRVGVAFDGDGDRAILCDRRGRIVDGDAVLLICARQLKAEGQLRGNAVVATVMSNIGLEIALRQLGIDLVRCAVGDKYVMEELLARNLSLGGEQSGHLIFADVLTTGDGLITLMSVLRVMAVTGRELGDLAGDLQTYPQVLLNVRVTRKTDLADIPEIGAAIRRVEQRLGDGGRVLVRYSGTEPLLRVMLEGQDRAQIDAWGREIVEEVERHLA